MSDHDESQDALSRLQSALDRVAARAAVPEPPPNPRLGEVAERLDTVIARLRDALGEG
ncbi:MAG: hypothetical protein JO157_05005 [Acetobacteraceae bacterium]|nr:hypothetical protein [Acetobacteraceae bacterium]